MKRLIDFLAPVGLVACIVGGLAYVKWSVGGHTVPGHPSIYLIVGGVLILAHLLLRWESIVRAVGGRQLRYGTNMIVLGVVVLGLLGGINYIASRRIVRWDLTKNKRYSLSDETRKVVEGLKQDVKITYFQRTGQPELAEGRDRLQSYQALSDHLKVDYVDPYRDPGRARAFGERGPWPVLIFEKEGRRERITSDSEEAITNALIKVTRTGKRTVCFVEGEGERSINDSGETGFSQVKAALEKGLYDTRQIVLLREKSVPKECTIVAVAGPENDLLPPVVDALRSFVAQGGKALVLADAEIDKPTPELRGLLAGWDVDAGKDIVVDNSGVGSLFGTGPFTPIAAPPYPNHEITKGFRMATAFHMARSVKPGHGGAPGITAKSLLETAPQSWAETDLTLKEPITFDKGKDTRGPISLGVAVTVPVKSSDANKGKAGGQSDAKKDGRVVVIGDADFASNQLLGFQGNRDFFLNAIAWLSEDTDLISIRPKQPDDQRMFLSRSQRVNVTLLALLILPGLWIVLGIIVWWRRR